jgi:hypothetical protein
MTFRISTRKVRSVCKLIEEVVILLIIEEVARLPDRKERIIEVIEEVLERYVLV